MHSMSCCNLPGLDLRLPGRRLDAGPAGPFGGHATLNDGLGSIWKLDEESGTRFDEVGGNDLTDNNNVLFGTGLDGNAASFAAASTQYFTHTVATFPPAEQDFTFGLWAKPTSATLRVIVNSGSGGGGGGAGKWQLYRGNGNSLVLGVDGSGDQAGTATVNGSAWVRIDLVYTTADKTMKCYVNNTLDITAVGTGTGAYTAGNDLFIGAQVGAGFPYDGLMDEIGFWSRVLTAQERTDLYNAGAGLFY